jgi:hypothetical protein
MTPTTSPSGHMLVEPGTVLGKRPRRADDEWGLDSHQPRTNKKGKEKMAVSQVLDATGSSSKAHHKPATRTQAGTNRNFKTAGGGAGKLTAMTVQEVYHQSLPGPSVQQVLVWHTAPEERAWIEGSVEGRTQHQGSNVVEQEVVEHEEQAEELFKIPPRLKERHRALLAATQTDWKRAAVDVLKCRLCPGADFSDFEDFKRHCDTSEAHPSMISFCNRCGDFFARGDALKRHHDKPPGQCIKAVVDKANLKCREIVRAHKVFEETCTLADYW